MSEANQHQRAQASAQRRALHQAISRADLDGMREAIHNLYVDADSPLKSVVGSDVKRIDTYAPLVEAVILARIYAAETPLWKEMQLNLRHTHKAFGVSEEDYLCISQQLDGFKSVSDALNVDWCVNTCLHGRVKPFRHIKLFNHKTDESSSDCATKVKSCDIKHDPACGQNANPQCDPSGSNDRAER